MARRVDATQITEAIYTDGVLKPTGQLDLREDQRVRVIVESLDEQPEDRSTALARLKAGIERRRSCGSLSVQDHTEPPISLWAPARVEWVES